MGTADVRANGDEEDDGEEPRAALGEADLPANVAQDVGSAFAENNGEDWDDVFGEGEAEDMEGVDGADENADAMDTEGVAQEAAGNPNEGIGAADGSGAQSLSSTADRAPARLNDSDDDEGASDDAGDNSGAEGEDIMDPSD